MSLCRKQESNLHRPFGRMDFKSIVSTNSTIAASFLQYRPFLLRIIAAYIPVSRTYTAAYGLKTHCGCKVKVLNHNIQNNLHNLILHDAIKFTIWHCNRHKNDRRHAVIHTSAHAVCHRHYTFLLYIRIIPIERFYCERKELICSLQVRILFSVLCITLFR